MVFYLNLNKKLANLIKNWPICRKNLFYMSINKTTYPNYNLHQVVIQIIESTKNGRRKKSLRANESAISSGSLVFLA